jgi:hypothetical protein
MRRLVSLLPLVLGSHVARADPSPDKTAALVSAAVAAGDWRRHAVDPASPSGEITPLLALDLRGAHLGNGRVRLAATGVALAGASLIAASHHDRWCSGPACAIGAVALFAVAPLLQAAAREGQ